MAAHLAPAEIFKTYDIRGIVDRSITPDITRAIGRAIGSELRRRGGTAVAVGRDGRLSGPWIVDALAEGLQASGADVIDIGSVPTPTGYFAAHALGCDSVVMVTGSHNPPEYNGLKMVLCGHTLYGDDIQTLRQRILNSDFSSGTGHRRRADPREDYLQRITTSVTLARPLHLAVDCGNGVAGALAPELFRRLGCAVEPLFCEVDGTFPNHHPDPSIPHNLQDLIRAVTTGPAELGFAFDGDGDRLGVVTKRGNIIFPDRQLMLFAADVLQRVPGATIIYDVKSTRKLKLWIEQHGGRPLMWKTGHSLVKAKMKETGAELAGEMSGHTFFKERWYGFDDALYAGARLLEILSHHADPSAVLEALPDSVSTPELKLELSEGENYRLIERLQAEAKFPAGTERIVIDGLRVEYSDGFGLARSSNTTPVVVLRFEADTPAALTRIQADFRAAILALKADARLPF
jgi:phosphomannomutase/phosphoglucomutase